MQVQDEDEDEDKDKDEGEDEGEGEEVIAIKKRAETHNRFRPRRHPRRRKNAYSSSLSSGNPSFSESPERSEYRRSSFSCSVLQSIQS